MILRVRHRRYAALHPLRKQPRHQTGTIVASCPPVIKRHVPRLDRVFVASTPGMMYDPGAAVFRLVDWTVTVKKRTDRLLHSRRYTVQFQSVGYSWMCVQYVIQYLEILDNGYAYRRWWWHYVCEGLPRRMPWLVEVGTVSTHTLTNCIFAAVPGFVYSSAVCRSLS